MKTRKHSMTIFAVALWAVLVIVIIVMAAYFVNSKKTKKVEGNKTFTLGAKYTATDAYAYKSDKYDLVYKDGCFAKIQDDIVKMVQWSEAVPDWKKSCEDILKMYPEYTREDAVFECYDGEGNKIVADLSVAWENAEFAQLYVYWKTDKGEAYSILLCPGSVTTVTHYLYYSDLEQELAEDTTGGSANGGMTEADYEEMMKQLEEQGVYDDIDDGTTDVSTADAE